MEDNKKIGRRRIIKEEEWKHCIPFSPTNGNDQVKTSLKLGSQYGCSTELNCLMFITLFSYFNTAAASNESEALSHRHHH